MFKFREFISAKDSAEPISDQTELLKRIIHDNGGRFRSLLKNIIRNGDLDDDLELLKDIKELYRSMAGSSQNDQFPIHNRKPSEIDIVSRPKADGGAGPSGSGESE